MYSVEKINEELQNFCKYMDCSLPPVKHLQISEERSDAFATFCRNTPSNNEYTIAIHPSFHKLDKTYKTSVLWHEFTHLYDWIANQNMNNELIFLYMKSYSEAHAIEIQTRFLYGVSRNESIDINARIQTQHGRIGTIQGEICKWALSCRQSLIKFRNTHDYNQFKDFILRITYCCGLIKIVQPSVHETEIKKIVCGIINVDKLCEFVIERYMNSVVNDDISNACAVYKFLIQNIYPMCVSGEIQI